MGKVMLENGGKCDLENLKWKETARRKINWLFSEDLSPRFSGIESGKTAAETGDGGRGRLGMEYADVA